MMRDVVWEVSFERMITNRDDRRVKHPQSGRSSSQRFRDQSIAQKFAANLNSELYRNVSVQEIVFED